jgi:CubicO group peptidase (beta-lactamase class C family)
MGLTSLLLIGVICLSSSLAFFNEFENLSDEFVVNDDLTAKLSNTFGVSDEPKTIKEAIDKSRTDVESYIKQTGSPGIVAGISVKGKNVWMEAFGETDVENGVKTHVESVWRLASISKSVTTSLVGKLIDQGKLDLDKSIHSYLSEDIFPRKKWNSKPVDITLKQVMSHMAGLRESVDPDDYDRVYRRANVTETIAQFKDAPLINEPGTVFAYSNFGFQIVGAIIESVMKVPYEHAINNLLRSELNMTSTFCERREFIIPRRARYYQLKAKRMLSVINADIMDDLVSVENWWPAGGLVSTVPDQLKFGNAMLKSYYGNGSYYVK